MNTVIAWIVYIGPAQVLAAFVLALTYLGGMGHVASTTLKAFRGRPKDEPVPAGRMVRFLASSVAYTLFWPLLGGQALAAKSFGELQ